MGKGFGAALRLLILVLALPATATAASIGIGDFGPTATLQEYEGLGLSVSNPTPVVIAGATYTTNNGTLRYTQTLGGLAGGSAAGLGSDTDLGWIDIVLGAPVLRAGLQFGASVPFGWTGEVSFFDEADVLLGTVTGSGTSGVFAGWEADAGQIARLRVTDTATNSNIIAIDDLRLEAVPEPSVLLMVAGGLLAVGAWRASTRPIARRAGRS